MYLWVLTCVFWSPNLGLGDSRNTVRPLVYSHIETIYTRWTFLYISSYSPALTYPYPIYLLQFWIPPLTPSLSTAFQLCIISPFILLSVLTQHLAYCPFADRKQISITKSLLSRPLGVTTHSVAHHCQILSSSYCMCHQHKGTNLNKGTR